MEEGNKRKSLSNTMRKCFKMGLFKIIPIQGNAKDETRTSHADLASEADVVVDTIGEYGWWQTIMTILLALFSFPCTFHIYLPTYTAMETKYWCKVPAQLAGLSVDEWVKYSQPKGSCEVRVLPDGITAGSILNNTAPLLNQFRKCTEWEFEGGETIISEWQLICDRRHLTELAEVLFLIGIAIGGVVGGFISDKFGRKRILMSMITAQSILAIIALLVKSYIQYALVRLVMGLVSVSVVYAAFVLVVELVGGKWITIAGVCIFFPLPLSYIIVSLASLALPNWRDLQLSLSLFGCLLIPLWCIIPESPRWLVSMGKLDAAKTVLQRVAKFNKIKLPSDVDKILQSKMSQSEPARPSITMLFKQPLLKTTVCLFIAWFAMTMGYYGLLLNTGNLNLGNLHVASIVLAVVEIPAIAISIPIILKAGMKRPIFFSMMTCGIACILSEVLTVVYNKKWILILCFMIGKFAIGTTNMMLPIFTAELYPTVVRNLGVGGSQVSAGLALIGIPYLWHLAPISVHFPMLVIAVLCIIGGISILFLSKKVQLSSLHNVKTLYSQKKSSIDKPTPQTGTLTIADDRGRN